MSNATDVTLGLLYDLVDGEGLNVNEVVDAALAFSLARVYFAAGDDADKAKAFLADRLYRARVKTTPNGIQIALRGTNGSTSSSTEEEGREEAGREETGTESEGRGGEGGEGTGEAVVEGGRDRDEDAVDPEKPARPPAKR